MTTIRELYHQIENVEQQASDRDLSDAELETISGMQDQISDIEHPGYEMKELFESVDTPNDHLMFTVFSKENGCPVDSFKVYREGDRYFVSGQRPGLPTGPVAAILATALSHRAGIR